MIRHLLLGAVVALALTLTGCDNAPAPAARDQSLPRPALWEITAKDGTVEGWLFGTIHALPDGTEWDTPLLDDKMAAAGELMVEVAALRDQTALAHEFAALARTPGLPPLSQRIAPSERPELAALLAGAGYLDSDFTSVESWAAALTLAQTMRGGNPRNGVDKQVLSRFDGRPVLEFEGAAKQLGIFDRLPEAKQRSLLSAIIREAPDSEREALDLAAAWQAGDMKRLDQENRQGMLADPFLRDALLVKRNADWAQQLSKLLPNSPPIFVAVGAAHMAGTEGLPALMAHDGYTVKRIQ